jgi:hypothetical protein
MQTVESFDRYLRNLAPGSILDVATESRHYEVLISGHPSLCPTAVSARLRGSLESSGEVHAGFVGRGMRLAFQRLTDGLPVITSAIQEIYAER